MTALGSSTPETELGALIDTLRQLPKGADELAALLPENLPIYDGRSAAETGRLRGYLFAAFADTGLPAAALPYLLESLHTGYTAYEVAGAAIGVRGVRAPSAEILAALRRAVENLSGADGTVSFESYKPAWPYRQPTTALTELAKTFGHFEVQADAVRTQLARHPERFPGPVPDEHRHVLDLAGSSTPAVESSHSCCADMPVPDQLPQPGSEQVVLEDQDGRAESFQEFFRGKPSVVAFFYTRCENPYKCSLTITKLAALQRRLEERGLAGAVNVAAITYDPDFDLPHRLKLYGDDRGMRFGADARLFRAASGFAEIRRRFDLGVNYGPSTVNQHRTEVYVLDQHGRITASFTRLPWEIDSVLSAVESTAAPEAQVR